MNVDGNSNSNKDRENEIAYHEWREKRREMGRDGKGSQTKPERT
jgi:hypothetical protein